MIRLRAFFDLLLMAGVGPAGLYLIIIFARDLVTLLAAAIVSMFVFEWVQYRRGHGV